MSPLSSVVCSELSKACGRMSDRLGWTRLCFRCERVYARYGKEVKPVDIDDPLEVFDDTNVEEIVMGFVVYILWLKRQPDSFEKYLRVRECRPDLWRSSVYKLWTL